MSDHLTAQRIEARVFQPFSPLAEADPKWSKQAGPNDLLYFCRSQQIRNLFAMSNELPRQPLETAGLPFDRFLLKHSRIYKSTKVLARRVGIRLVPETGSIARCVTLFNPCENYVTYTPIDRELRWSVERFFDPSGDFQAKRAHLDMLRTFVTSAFHDLNHRILFRTFAPSNMKSDFEVAKRYFAMVESLVMLRDVQLSSEVGRASDPLIWLNVMYESLGIPVCGRNGMLSFDVFRRVLIYLYANNLGYSDSDYRRLRLKAGISSKELPIFPHFYKGFFRNAVQPWFREYQKRFAGKLELPPRAKRGVPVFVTRAVLLPEDLMVADKAVKDLFCFFQDLFE